MSLAAKSWYLSVTIWTGVALIVSGLGKLVGVDIDHEELAALLVALSDPISQVVGGLVVVWGRKRATTRLTK